MPNCFSCSCCGGCRRGYLLCVDGEGQGYTKGMVTMNRSRPGPWEILSFIKKPDPSRKKQNNADIYSQMISKMIKKFVKNNKKRSCFFKSMGYVKYLSTLKIVDGVIGNSSSGLLEAPTLKIGTVNIGDRQKDRLKAASVIDCRPNKNQIIRSINKIFSKKFRKKVKKTRSPYGQGGAIEKSYNIIKNVNFKSLTKKKFYNLKK